MNWVQSSLQEDVLLLAQIYEDFIKQNDAKAIKAHWEYFYHQSKDMILTDGIPEELVDEFLLLNESNNSKTRVD